jgi:hypothetical protein
MEIFAAWTMRLGAKLFGNLDPSMPDADGGGVPSSDTASMRTVIHNDQQALQLPSREKPQQLGLLTRL